MLKIGSVPPSCRNLYDFFFKSVNVSTFHLKSVVSCASSAQSYDFLLRNVNVHTFQKHKGCLCILFLNTKYFVYFIFKHKIFCVFYFYTKYQFLCHTENVVCKNIITETTDDKIASGLIPFEKNGTGL